MADREHPLGQQPYSFDAIGELVSAIRAKDTEASLPRTRAVSSEHVKQVVLSFFERVQQSAAREEPFAGLPTGLTRLDEITGGLSGGELILIAGRPGSGKTALALNIAAAACHARNTPAALFSLEMQKPEIVRRLLCSEARVDGGRFRNGMLSRDDWSRLAGGAGPLTDLPFFIDDVSTTLADVREEVRRLHREHGIGLVIIDYLQLMRSGVKSDDREREIGEISRSLKALSKELDVAVVALSQLNRNVEARPRSEKRPQLSDVRESGALEEDADLVLFVYRPEMYAKDEERAHLRGLAEVIVAKQRAGPTGVIKCRFFAEFARFEDLAEGEFDDCWGDD